MQCRFSWCQCIAVFNEVAQMGIFIVTNRCFHRNRLFGNLHDLADLVFRNLHLQGQGCRIWLMSSLLQNLTANAVHLIDGLNHVHWNTNGAGLIGNRTGNGLTNPPSRIGRKLITTAILKLIHCFHQANIALLNQIKELQTAVGILFSNRDHQTQVSDSHFPFGFARALLTRNHLLVDFF